MSNNPLHKFFRKPKIYVSLPGQHRYSDDIIEFTDNGELPVYPMTGADEIIMKNPDGLLNGESLVSVIKSCVPAVKNPKKLLTNDLDVLVTAIRYATYGDDIEVQLKCPSCEATNNFKIDISDSLAVIQKLEDEYVVSDNGLDIHLKPYTFKESIAGLHVQFEQSKIIKAMASSEMTDAQRSELMTETFIKAAQVNENLLVDAIDRIVTDDGHVVIDRNHIKEFIKNAESLLIDKIEEMIKNISSVGIDKEKHVSCPGCHHEWDTTIDFNPVNFSLDP